MILKALNKIKRMVQNAPRLYEFHTITAEQIPNYPIGLEQIKNREFDGFLIKNFLSSEEAERMVAEFRRLGESEYVKTPVGGVYPRNFQQVFEMCKNDSEELSRAKLGSYFEECQQFYDGFEKRFGLDFPGKIENALKSFGGNRPVEVPKGVGGQGQYAFSTFRCLNPETGEMGFHTGNLFRDIYAKFYEHLELFVDTHNQLSFFVLLQKPESGGGLSLYDIEWEEGQQKYDDRYVLDKDGRKRDINGFDRKIMSLNPSVGDMILFNGAHIWHRVEFVHGKSDRLTIGGFLGITKDDTKVIYWS